MSHLWWRASYRALFTLSDGDVTLGVESASQQGEADMGMPGFLVLSYLHQRLPHDSSW